jgi:hypothetical protein
MKPLTDPENEDIFQRRILPRVLGALTSKNSQAVLAFLAGQSAAGKSKAIAAEAERINRAYGFPIVLQRDLLREFFPAYREQLRKLGPEGYKLSETDTWKWYEKIKLAALKAKVPILIESTFRQPEAILKDVGDFFEAGFRIEVTALAVHPEISKAGVFFRYEREIETEGQGRFVDLQTHRAALKGLVQTVELLERDERIRMLTIAKRDATTICRVFPAEHSSTDASHALLMAHASLEAEEIEGIARLWDQVNEKMGRRDVRPQEREAVRSAIEEFNEVSRRGGIEGPTKTQEPKRLVADPASTPQTLSESARSPKDEGAPGI